MEKIWCMDASPETLTRYPFERLKELLVERESDKLDTIKSLLTLNTLTDGDTEIDLSFTDDFYSKIVNINDECLCKQFVSGEKVYYTKKSTALAKGAAGTVYKLTNSTNDDNQSLILKVMENVDVKDYITMRLTEYPNIPQKPIIERYLQNNPLVSTDNKRITISFQSDNFSNQTILHMLLNIILSRRSDNFVYQYDAFICNEGGKNMGYNIIEFCNSGDLSDFINKDSTIVNNVFIDDVMTQILTPLAMLKPYEFVHSDLKCKNVFVNTDISGKVTYKIADYDKSSINWNGCRFHNNGLSIVPDIGKNCIKKIYDVKKTCMDSILDEREGTYSISDYTSPVMTNFGLRMNNIAFYTSFDIYTIYLSLLLEPKVWEWFNTEEAKTSLFYNCWYKYLWINGFYAKDMTLKIKEQHDTLKDKILEKAKSYRFLLSLLYDTKAKLLVDIDSVYKVYLGNKYPYTKIVSPIFRPFYKGLNDKLCIMPCKTYKWDDNKRKYVNPNPNIQHDISLTSTSKEIDVCKTNKYSQAGVLYGRTSYNWDYCKK